MNPRFSIDPRLKNLDHELADVVFQKFQRNIGLVGIHLRDARNMLDGARQIADDKVLGKAALLLAAAALESNLVYLSGVALQIAEKRPGVLFPPQLRHLKGIDEMVDDNGRVVDVPARQSLGQRLQVVPSLLAR